MLLGDRMLLQEKKKEFGRNDQDTLNRYDVKEKSQRG